MNIQTYTVSVEDDLDFFDYSDAGEHFYVYVEETNTWYAPVWCRRSNGDIDGLEGWNTV